MIFMAVKDMRPHRLKRFLRMPEFDLHLELHRLDCLGSFGMLDSYTFCRENSWRFCPGRNSIPLDC